MPLKLSHSDIAELPGSQRPSVSSRLPSLAASDQVMRRGDRSWLLRGDPPPEVRDMRLGARLPDRSGPDGAADRQSADA